MCHVNVDSFFFFSGVCACALVRKAEGDLREKTYLGMDALDTKLGHMTVLFAAPTRHGVGQVCYAKG